MPRNAAVLLVGLVAAFVLAVAWHDRGMAVDDAYITFRYAENLAAGHGLRWNPDSAPCEGYTNFSYVVGLALLSAMGVPPVLGAMLLATAGVLLLAGLFAAAVRGGPGAPLALVPAVLVFAPSDFAVHASRGLETVLFAAVGGWQLVATARLVELPSVRLRHAASVATSAILGFLTRPDGVLLAGMLFLGAGWLVWRQPERRRVWSWALGAWLLAGGVYAAVKYAVFGYLLPNPFYAKAAVSGFAGLVEMRAFLGAYGPILALCALVAVLRPWWLRPRPNGGCATAFLACLVVVPWLLYGSKIVHEIGFAHRFAWPVAVLAGLATCRGIAAIELRRPKSTLVVGWIALLVAVAMSAPSFRGGWERLQEPRRDDPVTAGFLRLGEAIHSTGLAPQLQLFCANAGATPYAAGAHHIDPAGLVDDGYCKRTPPEERQRYQATHRFDIVAWNVFPASPGAISFAGDERAMQSRYLRQWWEVEAGVDAGIQHHMGQLSIEQRQAEMFLHMAVLRECGTLVGEMDLGSPRVRLFVYVWKQSPHHDRLVEHLRSRVDIGKDAIDYVGRPF